MTSCGLFYNPVLLIISSWTYFSVTDLVKLNSCISCPHAWHTLGSVPCLTPPWPLSIICHSFMTNFLSWMIFSLTLPQSHLLCSPPPFSLHHGPSHLRWAGADLTNVAQSLSPTPWFTRWPIYIVVTTSEFLLWASFYFLPANKRSQSLSSILTMASRVLLHTSCCL